MSNRDQTMLAAGLLIVAMTFSVGLAKLGHPGSLWLWRDMLGVM